jgi:tetratricopeptide (TPR) repeat protein
LVALAVVIGYGIFFIPVDIAHSRYLRSFQPGEAAVESVRAARAFDPGLRLYALQEDYLSATSAAYERALELEPTWDTGWLNRAALAERQGDLERAMQFLERARQISNHNPAWLHWARLAEQTTSDSEDTIVAAYLTALTSIRYNKNPPFSEFWSATPLRIRALEQYSRDLPLDVRYRILKAHPMLGDADALVPEAPQTAAEWWVVGQDLLMKGEVETAVNAFSQAVSLNRSNGDYYVSRARAAWMNDPEAARRDLDLGELLGTQYEYPNAVRVNLTKTPEEIYRLRAAALPPRVLNQNFEGVLFTRAAGFELLGEMRYPGPGTQAMQPWYDIAAEHEANGQIERAINAYRAILDYAPDETQARQELARLQS